MAEWKRIRLRTIRATLRELPFGLLRQQAELLGVQTTLSLPGVELNPFAKEVLIQKISSTLQLAENFDE